MPSKAVADAVEARLGASWTAVDGTIIPVFPTNAVGGAPADGSPFLIVQYPVSNEEQISIGSPGAEVWREEGAIRFVLNIRRGGRVDQGLIWADELRALFRGKQFAHVSTFAPSAPVLDDSNDRGNYWILSFAVPYYFDRIA